MYSAMMYQDLTANVHEWSVGIYNILEKKLPSYDATGQMFQLVSELVQKVYHTMPHIALLPYTIMEYVDRHHWHQFLFLYSLKAEGLLTK